MFEVLSSTAELAASRRKLLSRLREGKELVRMIGHQGDSGEHKIYWCPDVGMWSAHYRARNRYWYAFGLSDPTAVKSKSLNVSAEINPPRTGINRRVGGVFLTDGQRVYLGHRGNNINQVTKRAFRRHFHEGAAGHWIVADDDGRGTEIVLIHKLDSSGLVPAIARFVREVQRIKDAVRK